MDTSLPADPTNTDQNPGTSGGPKGDRDFVVTPPAAASENPDQAPKSPQPPKGERETPLKNSTER